MFLSAADAQPQDASAEVRVKAATVHKIAKFVTWPENRFTNDGARLRFCVLGDDAVLDAFEALQDRHVRGRQASVDRAPEPGAVAESCDVLYLADDERYGAGEWLDALSGQPVLTFAEAGGFAGEDSIVAMALHRDKVSFSINLKANENTQLRISGQLLQLAATADTPERAP